MTGLTKNEKTTLEAYDQNATSWSDAHSTSGFWSEELVVFHKLLPKGRILEIGCGGGRDAKELIEVGYDYIGTDISKGFVEEAINNNPGAKFVVSSVYDLDFKDNSFDGFWASAVLLHVPKKRMQEALGKLHILTRKDGVGFIAIKEGEKEEMLEEESSDGNKYTRLWSFYSDAEYRDELEESGFEVIDYIYKPMSERTRWLIYFIKNT